MKSNFVTYYARKSKFLALSATLLMIISIGLRMASFAGDFSKDAGVILSVFCLPLVAGVLFSARLLLRGEKQLYKTIMPAVLLSLYGFFRILSLPLSFKLTILYFAFNLLIAVLYIRIFSGKQKSLYPLCLLVSFVALAVGLIPDGTFFLLHSMNSMDSSKLMQASDFTLLISFMLALLSVRRISTQPDDSSYIPRYGDRLDGRRIRRIDPMAKLSPYFMVNRNGANNLLKDKIGTEAMELFIHQKRKEGHTHFGITHVILAAYVRTLAELPALNRFISGQKIYARFHIVVNMVVKKELKKESPDTVIKIIFDPHDTAIDVYRKFEEKLKEAQKPALDSHFDKLAEKFDYIPGLLLKFTVWILKVMDYFGNLPPAITDLSPFHGSLFITSMGSLGIPPIYHHLYDFGNVPIFCAFGCKRTEIEVQEDGTIRKKKYLDYSFVTDERIVDGFYYAAALKKMRSYMSYPDRLDVPPAEVVEDSL